MLNHSVSSTHANLNHSNAAAQKRSVGHLSNYALNNPIKSLAEGQIIKGEITDLRNNEITITLEDNTRVTGFVEDGANFSIGETAAFQVTEISPGKIFLKALENSRFSSENITILKALEEAGFPKNEKNQTIVQELLLNQMPINKQSILKILQQSYANKGIDIRTLVLMNKHNIPITKENAVQFEHYQNQEHRLIQEINLVAEELPKWLHSIPSSDLPKIGEKLFSTFLFSSETKENFTEPLVTFSSVEEKQEFLSILKNFFLPQELETKIEQGTAALKEIGTAIQNAMQLSAEIDNEHITNAKENYLKEHPELKDMDIINIPKEVFLEVPKTKESFEQPVMLRFMDEFSTYQKENLQLGGILQPEQLEEFSKQLSSFPLSPIMQEKIQNGTASFKELFTVIKNSLPLVEDSSLEKLFHSKEFETVLKETILSSWTFTPKNLKKPDIVKHLYTRMEQQLTDIKELLSQIQNKEFTKLITQTQDMKDNLDFMKTLNQLFTYVQLPLKLKEHTLHSDLYVYTKKRELKNNNSNISVLLHLDMEYLGPLDIYLSLLGRQITSKFYLQDTKVQKLISSYIGELEEKLTEKGYSFHTEILAQPKKIDIVKDFIQSEKTQSSLKRFTFDIRA